MQVSVAFGLTALTLTTLAPGLASTSQVVVGGIPLPATPSPSTPRTTETDLHAGKSSEVAWRLNSPAPITIAANRNLPATTTDKFLARAVSIEKRAEIRAFEGAPPVIPHPTSGLHVQTCRACHATGLTAGTQVARMMPHTELTNCTQCHVEQIGLEFARSPHDQASTHNTFVGLRSSGCGGSRASAGAPPCIPHTIFMRTNCVSCHGDFGYEGWRPDHLPRTNCAQCHAPTAELEQLAPGFDLADVADGSVPTTPR